MRPRIILKPAREKPLLRGHPWVFSGAIDRIEGEGIPGDLGEAYSASGQFLGTGHLNPRSQIVFRLLSSRREEIGASFFRDRILHAFRLRERRLKGATLTYRIVNGEGDFLPGLIIDRYGGVLVIQLLTAGMDLLKGLFIDLLSGEFHSESIYERSDVALRKEEGLSESRGLLSGKEVPDWIDIDERDCHFRVNVKAGQKTGFYLDQRENRCRLREVSSEKHVLDVCCYTGGFSVYAGLGGARELTLIDSSSEALEMAALHLRMNRLEGIAMRPIRGNAFDVMRSLEPEYDLIVLDPPPFARKKSALPQASRGYKDLNLQAFRLLRPEGLLFTFSCSHHMDWDLFQKVVFAAAVDSGRRVQVLGRMSHPVDHPFNLSHPEGEYLKGLICRAL